MTRLEEIDKTIKALQEMLQVWETPELKHLLCSALEARSLFLLQGNKESESNDILN